MSGTDACRAPLAAVIFSTPQHPGAPSALERDHASPAGGHVNRRGILVPSHQPRFTIRAADVSGMEQVAREIPSGEILAQTLLASGYDSRNGVLRGPRQAGTHPCCVLHATPDLMVWVERGLAEAGRDPRGCLLRRFLAAALGLRGTFGSFADQFHAHQAGDEFLHANTIEINGSPFGVGVSYDPESVLFVLDALSFGENLHNCLLICCQQPRRILERCWSVPASRDGPGSVRLEADDVLRLQAFGPLANFKLHGLSFIERLVPVHLDGAAMNEYILAGLPLDEPIALASVEPLHCSLFFHCYYLIFVELFVLLAPARTPQRVCGP